MATYTFKISFSGDGEVRGSGSIGTINSDGGSRYFTIEQGYGINLYPNSLYKSNFVKWRVHYPSAGGYQYYYELRNTTLWITEDNMVIEAIFSSPIAFPSTDTQSTKFYHQSINYLRLDFSNFDEGIFLINRNNNSTISSLGVYDGYATSGWGIQFDQPRILKKSDYTNYPTLTIYFNQTATEGNPNIINYIWRPNNFTIVYDANGGTTVPSEVTVEPGTSITLPAAISRNDSYTSSSTDFAITFKSSYTGVSWSSKMVNPSKTTKYTFYKWSDGTNQYNANYAGYIPTGNTTFSAVWSASSTYSVTAPAITRSNSAVSRTITFDSPSGGTLTFSEASQSGTRKYTFKGWYDSSSGGNLVVEDQNSYNPTAAQTVYGQWSSSTTYNAITFPTGTREGYTLLGFSTNSSATKADSGCTPGASKVVSSTTYYAIWSLNDYKLSYDMNGGSGTIEEQTGSSSYTISSIRPTRIGWNFDGWATNKNAAASYSPGDDISLSEDTVLYAIWSQKIISSGSSVNTVISYGGQKYWYKFTPSSTGTYVIYSTGAVDTYVHLYNTAGTQLKTDDDNGDSNNFRLEYKLTGGTTYYYAVRYFNASRTGTITTHFGPVYTIQYDSKGGTSTPANQSKDWGTTIQITSDEILKTGYEFKGWSISSTATDVNYAPGADFIDNTNKTLYAVWKLIDYSISYILDNGIVSIANKTSYTVETSNFTLNNPTKTGYTFKGWSGTDLTGDTNTTVTISKGSTGDREYKAHWTINSHQFNLGSAAHVNTSGSTTSGLKQYGSTITLKATVDAGYTFGEWSSSNTNLIDNQSSANVSFSMPDGAITMTPSVSANQYTITYDIASNANSGDTLTNKPSTETYSYTGGTVKITSTIPKRTGYTFAGWCRNKNSTSNLLDSGTTIDQETSNITLYAVWEKSITVQYNINEGTGTTPTQQVITVYNKATGTSFGTLATNTGFSRPGYTFAGWSTTKNNSSTKVSGTTTFTNSTTTLYALWDINYYSVSTNIYTNGIDSDNGNSISSPTLVSGSTQSGKYAYGSVIKLTATAVDPYDFESWSQNSVDKGSGTTSNNGNKSECNFTITEDTTIIANFATGTISARFYCYDITSGSSVLQSSTTSKVKLWVRSKAATASTYGVWEQKSFSTKMTYSDSTYIQVLIENGEEYEFNSGSGINFPYTIPNQLTDILIQNDQSFSIPCKKLKTENRIKVNDVLKTSGYIKDPYFSMDENIASIWIGDKQIMGWVPSKIYPYKEDSLLIDTLYINNTSTIFNKSYQNNSAIKKVIIPKNITTISTNYLRNCSALRTIKFLQNSNLNAIGNYALAQNTNLLKIYLPNKLTNIGEGAFQQCTRLQKVILPKSILTIQDYAFYECANLQSIKLNHTGITSLPYSVFMYCTNLKTVILPRGLTSIGSRAFYQCTSLEKIIYTGTIEEWNNISIPAYGNTYLNGVPIQCIDGITYTNLK